MNELESSSSTPESSPSIDALSAPSLTRSSLQPKPHSGLATSAVIIGAAVATQLLGKRYADRHDTWYRSLRKPREQPPSWAFPVVWTTLYGLMTVSALRVARRPPSGKRTLALALWGLQLALNGAWSKIFFEKHRPIAALGESHALLGAIGTYGIAAGRVDGAASALMVPYIAWLAFANHLQTKLLAKNSWRAKG